MRKTLRILTLLAWIPCLWQPLRGQAPSVGINAGSDQQQQTKLGAAQTDKRGSIDVPLVVETHGRPKNDKEAAEEKADNDWKHNIDTWTVSLALAVALFTGALVVVGFLGVRAANRTLRAVERQANLMAGNVYIDGVRAVNLEVGGMPVIFVKIRNSGMVAAEVSVSIGAEYPGGAVKSKKDQRIVVPADGWMESFMPASIILTEDLLSRWNSGEGPLRVSGTVSWNQETIQYCYKYLAWNYGDRPDGVPRFVPCDFEPGLAIEASLTLAALPTFSATLSAVKNAKEPSPDPPNEPS